MKHHELIQLRKQKALVFKGYTQDGKEIYKPELVRKDLIPPGNTEYKFSSRQLKRFSTGLPQAVIKTRYIRPPGPRKIHTPSVDKPEITKHRASYCTGCGVTFTHKHLLRIHRDTQRCGGRFLTEEEMEFLKKLRLEREAQDRWRRHVNSSLPIYLTKAEKKAKKAEKLARREADIARRRSVRAAFKGT